MGAPPYTQTVDKLSVSDEITSATWRASSRVGVSTSSCETNQCLHSSRHYESSDNNTRTVKKPWKSIITLFAFSNPANRAITQFKIFPSSENSSFCKLHHTIAVHLVIGRWCLRFSYDCWHGVPYKSFYYCCYCCGFFCCCCYPQNTK